MASLAEEQYKAVFEHASDAILLTDDAATIQAVNQAALDMFGYSRKELVGQRINILMNSVDAHFHDDYMKRFFTEGTKRVVGIGRKVVALHKDGHEIAIDISLSETKTDDRHCFIAIIRNIEHLTAAQNELRYSEDRMRRAIQFAEIGIWDWNVQTDALHWSDMIPVLIGYEPGEIDTSFDAFINAIHPDDRDTVMAAINTSLQTGERYDIEHRVIWPDGTVRWLQETGDVIRDTHGKPLNMLGVARDITTLKEAEVARDDHEFHLNEAQYVGKIGHWSWDVDSGQLKWSDEIYRIFGYKPGSIEPTYERFLASLHPDDVERIKHSVDDAFTKGKKHSIDHRILLTNGDVRWVHEEAIAKLDGQGQPLKLMGTVQDITERKEFEAQLVLAKEQAEQANQSKNQFLSRMSHELRTPLNAILGFSQLLNLDDNLTEQQHFSLNEMLKAGDHLTSLIEDILDLSRIEQGELEIKLTGTPANKLLSECVTMMQPLADQSEIMLSCKCSPEEHYVNADPTRLKQILLNLISNAIKYNRPQGSVDIHCGVENGRYRFYIQDTGLGLSEEEIGQLFQPFTRLNNDYAIEGTGIGLVITKHLVELMGGTIHVDSHVGEGTTFWIELTPLDTTSSQT
ncbi:MAG: PAS domain S-box protein [Gammaproteobacteria bacterium]|nr:PAS domain S-box protein [Gammaproteobacteria bacterium]